MDDYVMSFYDFPVISPTILTDRAEIAIREVSTIHPDASAQFLGHPVRLILQSAKEKGPDDHEPVQNV